MNNNDDIKFSLEFSPQFLSTKRNLNVFSLISIFLFAADIPLKKIMFAGVSVDIGAPLAIPIMLGLMIIYLWIKYTMYINQEVKYQLSDLKIKIQDLFFKEWAHEKLDSYEGLLEYTEGASYLDHDDGTEKIRDFVIVSRTRKSINWLAINYMGRKKNGKQKSGSDNNSLAYQSFQDVIKDDELSTLIDKFNKKYKRSFPNQLEIEAPKYIACAAVVSNFFIVLAMLT